MNRNQTAVKSSMPRRSLRVLVVEDSEADSTLMMRALHRGGFEVTWERVDSAEQMENALAKAKWDLILADHSMPGFSAPEALALMHRRGLDLPFIIVSGYIDEETAVKAMRSGAHDYIMKDRLARLAPAVERELREAEVRRTMRDSQQELERAREELELRVEQRTADLKTTNLKLEKVIEDRRRLETELLEIAENERRRIGFDLHDDLGQKLTGLLLMAKGLEHRLSVQSHPCAAEARRIQELVDDITHHTHNLARQFSSLDVQGDDLETVLQGLGGNVERMFGIPCRILVKGTVPAFPHHTTTQLYKICQEAISNSIKHGKAKKVSISLRCSDGQLTLTIKNDGLPFCPPQKEKNRMGLRIMNYRASTIGAVLEIKPLTKGGALVTCSMCLKDPAKFTNERASAGTITGKSGSIDSLQQRIAATSAC
jgi:signal transduction histidine kinase